MIPNLFCETPLIMAQVDQNILQVKNGLGCLQQQCALVDFYVCEYKHNSSVMGMVSITC